MDDTELKELESAAEGILFASGEPVHIDRLCLALSLERAQAERILQRLADYYAYERRGIRLLRVEESWQLCSSPDYADAIRKAFEIRRPAKLSQPALEVLTIIAYYQPTTRAFVDKIRGVDSGYTISLLLERKLVEVCGRLQVAGRPRLYRTTKTFLTSFHITSLEELPPLPEGGLEGQMRLDENGQPVGVNAAPDGESVPDGTLPDGEAVPESVEPMEEAAENPTEEAAIPEETETEPEITESVAELPENSEPEEPETENPEEPEKEREPEEQSEQPEEPEEPPSKGEEP